MQSQPAPTNSSLGRKPSSTAGEATATHGAGFESMGDWGQNVRIVDV